MRRFLLAAAVLICPAVAWAVQPLFTTNRSITITTGLTYQLVQPATQTYNSITIQNNNTADNCFVDVSGTVVVGNTTATVVTTANQNTTAAQASVLLQPGGSYQRYSPYLPRNAIVATCATTGDSLYVDTQ